MKNHNKLWNTKQTVINGSVPCRFWCFRSRLGCTWAFPWRPPARPELHLPSTVTCKCFEWVLPAGGGPAAPLRQTGSAVWGCQSLGWSDYGVAYRRDIEVKQTWLVLRHTDIKIRPIFLYQFVTTEASNLDRPSVTVFPEYHQQPCLVLDSRVTFCSRLAFWWHFDWQIDLKLL